MAIPNIHHLVLSVLVIAGIILISGSTSQVEGGCDPINALSVLLACQKSIVKEGPNDPPSQLCCQAIKAVGYPCTCEIMKPVMIEMYNMDKFVSVFHTCGSPIPPGTHCGSYTVPPASA